MRFSELLEGLAAAGIEEAAVEARLLFSHFSGLSAAALLGADPACSEPGLAAALSRRTSGEPLAYILGEAPFFRGSFAVGPGCLVPRADTERLVELAIERLPRGAHFADLCTGSGAIAVSVLLDRRDTTAEAIDVSEVALDYAKRNAERHGVTDRLTLCRKDLLTATPTGRYDAILSNPPYIPSATVSTLSREVRHEPSLALDGGADGLRFYRRLLSLAGLLTPGGFFLFECGYDQKEAMAALAAAAGYTFEPFYDYGKNFRVALITP